MSIYGDKYDLSLVSYTRASDKITLVCPDHGPFSKSMQTHRTWKQGCRICSHRHRYDAKILERDKNFANRAGVSHGNKYSYGKAIYTGAHAPINVTCPEHGDFPVIASNHLRGQGCPYCSGASTCDAEFKKKIESIHGGKLIVGPVTDMRHKVDARCSICGKNWRPWPKVLLEGHGCPICNRVDVSGFDMSKPAKLYLIKFTLLNAKEVFKLGITSQPIKKRVAGMQLQGRATYEILGVSHYEKGVHAYEDECWLKSQLEGYAYVGEPFTTNGGTELFTIDPRIVLKALKFETTHEKAPHSSSPRSQDRG